MQFADTGHSFDALLLYGHEFSLTIFDVLVFSFVDLLVQDYLIAAIITFFVGKVRRTALRWFISIIIWFYNYNQPIIFDNLPYLPILQVLIWIRHIGGRRNLARKTLIDKRFLIWAFTYLSCHYCTRI